MKKTLLSVVALLVFGNAQASSISGHCVAKKTDPMESGAYLKSFDVQVYSGSKLVIVNPELGPGRIHLAKVNKEEMPKLPSSDVGTPTQVRKPLPAGVERFSRFSSLAKEMGFTLVVDASEKNGALELLLRWRSSDDMQVTETYRCE